VWVRITGGDGDIFNGLVLNQPEKLTNVRAGTIIQFKVPSSGDLPLLVNEQYLSERSDWMIHPCDRCGLSELYDAPSDLLQKVFPAPAGQLVPEMFTAICGWCGGVQVVQRAGSESVEPPPIQTHARWWEFWR